MISLAALLFTLQFAQAADAKPLAFIICKLKGNVRTVKINLDDKGMCTTVYSKHGVEKEIGSGRNQGSCKNFLDNVRTNLEKSNWKCREVAADSVTESGG